MTVVDRDLSGCSGLKLSQAELAAAVDVTPQTVWEWQQAGMPYETRDAVGNQHVLDVAKVLTWLLRREIARASGGETQRDRLARVQADRIELDLAERRRQLVCVDDLLPDIESMIVGARTALLQIPERIAPALASIDSVDAIGDVLREEIEECLNRISLDDVGAFDAPGTPARGMEGARAHVGGALV